MDGIQTVAEAASKDQTTLIIFMMAGCIAMVCLVFMKMLEMMRSTKASKMQESLHTDLGELMKSVKGDTRWLKETHDVRNGDGNLIWYTDHQAIREQTQATKELTQTMQHLALKIEKN